MKRSSIVRFSVGFLAVAVLAMLAQVSYAAFQAEKGTLRGMIQTADGKPAVSLLVKLVKDQPIDLRRPGGGRRSTGIEGSGAVELQGPGGRSKVVAQATTDAQGKFTMNNVEVGDYRLEAGNKNIGWIWQDVTIEADKTLELNELKLRKIN